MPKLTYKSKSFHPATWKIIDIANDIIEEYQQDGLDLTLRQLYYQFVSRGYIANKQKEYSRLGIIINNARLAGLIDWLAIEDRTRNLKSLSSWDNPGQIVRAAADYYKLDHWKNQLYHVEVWIEKEALIGVISPICENLDVGYYACKGYVSQSEQWRAGQRFIDKIDEGKQIVVVHLGDHDPSGIDMTRDNQERLWMFSESDNVKVERIALNMDQVNKYSPPPNPAKMTDSRVGKYISKYGNESWELDALEPRVLRDLINKTVLKYRDDSIYGDILKLEEKHKKILKKIEKNWELL